MNKHKPIDYVVNCLENGYVVGVGEPHWYPGIIKQQIRLLCHEHLDNVVNHFMFECGTADDQETINAYLNSDIDLNDNELLQIAAKSVAFMGVAGPHIAPLFKGLRASNQRRTAKGIATLTVHFPEPTLHWDETTSPAIIKAHNKSRAQHYFECLEHHQLLNNPSSSLLIFCGAFHLVHAEIFPHALGQLINQAYPEKLKTIWPHMSDKANHMLKDILSSLTAASDPVSYLFKTTDEPWSNVSIHDLGERFVNHPNALLQNAIDAYWYCGEQTRHIDHDFLQNSKLLEKRDRFIDLRKRKK